MSIKKLLDIQHTLVSYLPLKLSIVFFYLPKWAQETIPISKSIQLSYHSFIVFKTRKNYAYYNKVTTQLFRGWFVVRVVTVSIVVVVFIFVAVHRWFRYGQNKLNWHLLRLLLLLLFLILLLLLFILLVF